MSPIRIEGEDFNFVVGHNQRRLVKIGLPPEGEGRVDVRGNNPSPENSIAGTVGVYEVKVKTFLPFQLINNNNEIVMNVGDSFDAGGVKFTGI